MKITKQQFDELKNASDLEQVLKAVGIEVESETFPERYHTYWCVNIGGKVSPATWENHPVDFFRQSLGNVHRTKEDAEHYKATTLRRWQAEIAIRRWRDEHCPFTPNWTDEMQNKWYRYYHHYTERWMDIYARRTQEPRAIYFATEADVKACAEALPDEWNALLID